VAGLQPNDVIMEVDGIVIRNENHFFNLISSLPVGQRIRLQVWRDRKKMMLDAVVGDWARAQALFRSTP
jgi:S1-C subfamily serine protease